MHHLTSIPLDQLQLVAMAARLRSRNGGRTAQLCALPARPVVEVDCRSTSQWVRPRLAEQAQRMGRFRALASPLQRGHISMLYEKVRRERGLAEVRATWRTGLRSLRAEPHHVLNGGVL